MKEQGAFMFRLSLEGEYQYIEKSKQTYTVEKIKETTAYQSLFVEKWLFNRHGEKIGVREAQSTDELSEIYDRSFPDLFFFLGIPHDTALAALTTSQRQAVLLLKKFEKKGITAEMLELTLKNEALISAIKK
jgi:hypothetical protein